MKTPNRLKIIFFIIYTIAVFTTGYYASSCKDAIIYRLDDPLEAEYIGNDGEKQEFIFDVQHHGRISVSYKAFNADRETANIVHSLFLLNKQNFAVSPKTPDTTLVYIVGKKKWLFLNPALKAMLNIYSP